jgi:hypothetical protein
MVATITPLDRLRGAPLLQPPGAFTQQKHLINPFSLPDVGTEGWTPSDNHQHGKDCRPGQCDERY